MIKKPKWPRNCNKNDSVISEYSVSVGDGCDSVHYICRPDDEKKMENLLIFKIHNIMKGIYAQCLFFVALFLGLMKRAS